MMGAIKAGMMAKFNTRSNSDFSNDLINAKRATGVSKAPPMPCTIRENTSMGSVGENAHNSEPKLNKPIAAKNTFCVPKRALR